MSGFLYFIPADVTRPAQLAEHGLAHAFERDAPGLTCCPCRNGPGGVSGTVVGSDRGGMIVGYYPEKQTWRKLHTLKNGNAETPKPDCYVGFYNDARPTPAELLRRDALSGYPVRMMDGNEWVIPTARGMTDADGDIRYRPCLPASMDLSEEGVWKATGVAEKYAALWSVGERFWDAMTGADVEKTDGGGRVTLLLPEMADGVVTALGTNYRIGAVEVALLGLLDQACCQEAIKAIIDWPVMERWLQKKTQQEAAGASSGT